MSDLSESLHAERTAANTTHVDCWACEAAQSQTIRDLEARLRRSVAAASHANAILEKLYPDEERLKEVWKDHWRDVLGLGEDGGGDE